MSECLGKISQVFAGRSKLFRVKTEVVGIAERLFKKEARFFKITRSRQALHKPERAHGKRPLSPRETVRAGVAEIISIDERVFDQRSFDRFHGRDPARVGRTRKSHYWHQQPRSIYSLPSLV